MIIDKLIIILYYLNIEIDRRDDMDKKNFMQDPKTYESTAEILKAIAHPVRLCIDRGHRPPPAGGGAVVGEETVGPGGDHRPAPR